LREQPAFVLDVITHCEHVTAEIKAEREKESGP
jgi:hypothetical protein